MQKFQELITKELHNFTKILISLVFDYSWTTSLWTMGVRGVEMKMLKKV